MHIISQIIIIFVCIAIDVIKVLHPPPPPPQPFYGLFPGPPW